MSDLTKYWDKIKGYIGPAAPMIGGLIGGPAGSTVGTMIASVLGVENKPEAILDHLEKNPDAVLKIKEMELTHKVKLEELSLKEVEAHIADTQNARATEIERMKAGGDNRFMYALATLIVIGFFGVVAGLYFQAIPESSKDVAYILLGTLAAEFGQVVRYFFGSSKGSSDKTAMLMKIGI